MILKRIGNVKLCPVLSYALHHDSGLGSGGIAPHILNLDTSWMRVGTFTLRWLCPPYPLGRRLDGSQNQSECYGEEKHFVSAGNRSLIPLSTFRNVVVLMSELPI
jgi:hypothetical protein